jgi:hypothetical protein
MAAAPLINGRAYDYTQIEAVVLGVPLSGINSINYTEEQDKTNNMGTGNRPVSRGKGPIDSSGSLDISMNDVEALRDAAPNGSLLQIPMFDIVIVFGNPQKPVVHVLKNVEFTTDGVESTTGDTDITRTFDIVISNVKYR